jgi:uncharacterized repeat protein (TIGR03803 family)
MLSGSTLYGTTAGGGSGNGTVYQMSTNGTGFCTMHFFGGGNDDGGNPDGPVVLSGSTLYGTTSLGGNSYNAGTLFQISTNCPGTNYAILFSFLPWVAENPYGALILSGTTLFGLGAIDTGNGGTLFAIETNGSDCANLHVFGGSVFAGIITNITTNVVTYVTTNIVIYITTNIQDSVTNVVTDIDTNIDTEFDTNIVTGLVNNTFPDGSNPNSPLLLAGSTLYGTTSSGGSNNFGTVFQINTDGSGYSVLHHFSNTPGDGYVPLSGLILSGSTLYGTTSGADHSHGTVFQINTNGTGFAILYGFGLTVADGYTPYGPLTLSNSTLYGTTQYGGSNNLGTVFQINTDGTSYQVLYNFGSGGALGGNPKGSLVLSDSTLYGVANGVLFSLAVPALPVIAPPTSSVLQITGIAQQGNDILISWTNSIGMTNALQGTTNALQGTASSGYDTNNLIDIFIVTNAVSSTTNYLDAGAVTNFSSRFYRVRLVP